ncbi:MAG: hypothetical protein QM744_04175 [Mesorhizobium sp.]
MFLKLHTLDGDEITINMAKIIHMSRSDAGVRKYTLLLAEGGTSYSVSEPVDQILAMMRQNGSVRAR